jgi:oxygen-independent coproporphyrinogen III oxidase
MPTSHDSPSIPPELIARYDVPGPRYTSYPTADTWSAAVGPTDFGAALEAAGAAAAAPLSFYVHLPFCRSLCLYCGCNVIVAKRADAADPYLDALAQEMDLVATRLGARRTVSQLHWGGGTPTFLDEDRLARLFDDLTARFAIAADAEVAIEIDPRVTTEGQLRRLRKLGFNRLSLGVQDIDPEVQAAIGRRQSLDETRAIVEAARALGFASISLDLIYGLPKQTPTSWENTLAAVIGLKPDRTAIYSFAYVPTLRPQQRRLPVAALPNGAAKLALLTTAHAAFTAAGYVPIGMDHFARAGDELARAARDGTLHRNFQGYTVRAARDVVGLGVTAISDLGGRLFAQNHRERARYEAAVAAGSLATARGAHLHAEDEWRREVIGALMCNFRVTLTSEQRARLGAAAATLDRLATDGLVRLTGNTIEVTAVGRFFLRNVAMVFDERTLMAPALKTGSRTI